MEHLRIKFMDDTFKSQNRKKSGRESWGGERMDSFSFTSLKGYFSGFLLFLNDIVILKTYRGQPPWTGWAVSAACPASHRTNAEIPPWSSWWRYGQKPTRSKTGQRQRATYYNVNSICWNVYCCPTNDNYLFSHDKKPVSELLQSRGVQGTYLITTFSLT